MLSEPSLIEQSPSLSVLPFLKEVQQTPFPKTHLHILTKLEIKEASFKAAWVYLEGRRKAIAIVWHTQQYEHLQISLKKKTYYRCAKVIQKQHTRGIILEILTDLTR